MATLDRSIGAVPIERLGDEVRARYRAIFAQSVAAGQQDLLILPWGILAAFIVPTLWLAVPHTRGWKRQANWAVVAFVIAFNLRLAWTTSSPNFACGYATGLMASWGIISTLTLLVWSSPQEEAARVIRRRRRKEVAAPNGVAKDGKTRHEEPGVTQENGLRRRNGFETARTDTDLVVTEQHPESEYVWQSFPANGPWSSRLNWAFDMTTNFRFVGMFRICLNPVHKCIV